MLREPTPLWFGLLRAMTTPSPSPSLGERRGLPEPRVTRAIPASRDSRVSRDLKDLRVTKVSRESKVLRVSPARKVTPEMKVLVDQKALRVPKDHKVSRV